jgi:acyl-CoA reductase-like NAD-dependent aldehyde dehydrogenase
VTALARTLAAPQAAYAAPILHIAGRWREGRHSKRHPVFDPATGQSIGSLGLASAYDVNDAIAAAERGFEAWKRVPAFKRSAALLAAAQRMQERMARPRRAPRDRVNDLS